jgi:hypothetical protein
MVKLSFVWVMGFIMHLFIQWLGRRFRKFIDFLFYGNFHYGICALALVIELQFLSDFSFFGLKFYTFLFLSVVLYYQYPYSMVRSFHSQEPRLVWYTKNRVLVKWTQLIILIIWLTLLLMLVIEHLVFFSTLSFCWWSLLLLFPLVAFLYYRHAFVPWSFSLRQLVWFKPFIIGFVWAGMTVVYPILFADLQHSQPRVPWFKGVEMFLSNFLFVSVLAILFDIKDEGEDLNAHFKSLLTKLGLTHLLLRVALPLAWVSVGWSIVQVIQLGFGFWSAALLVLPHLCLVWAVLSCKKPQAPLFYFLVIDGLMVLKAFCGIAAALIEPF